MWAGDEFWPPSPSRIEAGYVLETRHVVAPVVLDELRFPEGAVIRGIMVA
jgi:hypothetical protein